MFYMAHYKKHFISSYQHFVEIRKIQRFQRNVANCKFMRKLLYKTQQLQQQHHTHLHLMNKWTLKKKKKNPKNNNNGFVQGCVWMWMWKLKYNFCAVDLIPV